MLKKCFTALAIVLIIATMTMVGYGCNTQDEKTYKYNVVCTIFPAYDFTRAVIGDVEDVGVSMLLSPGAESHSYQPTIKQMYAISNSALFIYNGGESDHWVHDIVDSLSLDESRTLTMMSCIDKLYEEEITDEMTVDEEEEEEEDHSDYDEHVWTSPINAVKIVKGIRDSLIRLAPEHRDAFTANAAAYCERIMGVDALFRQVVADKVRNVIVFGDKFPVRYFVEEYDIEYMAAYPGCSNDAQASSKTITSLITAVRDRHIPIVFYIELSNERDADSICESTGAQKRLFHSCHNLSKADFDSGKTYVDFMTANAAVLREALC